ncbi:histidine--tRNA ligase [Herbiconiux sp. KACC 21604]|uniref:histidine--tRNA ligase n=1 Tax=unclassified Herbiconiux TaxID=2618217 RepID=UPI0014926A3A|nr:histidine--tRNA ligase [Herbiconiux sp. SALV-R1]QJU54008.1 histidine--tRNA ligase [Herbiconiux sp. SALV-R1]WPO85039.1 histidine--tRNA ligase [Herbiconiux sp. KACC 21604]
MATPVSAPRGMRDFLPADKAKRERVLGVIRSTYAAHGFDEIETPVVEDFDRLHAGLGGDNEKLAFNVMKRGLAASDLAEAAATDDPDALADLGLRFDLTVPLARFYATHRAALPQVFRAVQIAPVWRAERPQKGRYRQFVQCDIDIIGEAGILAEIELLTATLATLDTLGLAGCRIRINDRRILFGVLDAFGFAADEHSSVLITVDKLDKVGTGGVIDELRSKGTTPAAVDALAAYFEQTSVTAEATPLTATTVAAALPEGVAPDAVTALASIGTALETAGVRGELVFDPFLVRGMGYYTGTIFEIEHPDFSFSLGGGGRYDGMIGRFLGEQVPACGFSIGFERIIDLIDDPAGAGTRSIVLVHDKAAEPERLLALKTQFVDRGERVRLERRTKNLAPLLDRAAASGFTHFALVGRDATRADDLELKELSAPE